MPDQGPQTTRPFSSATLCLALFFVFPLIFLLLARPSSTVPLWAPQKLPDPRFDAAGVCNRDKPSGICDPDDILGKRYADKIDDALARAVEGDGATGVVTCQGSGSTRGVRMEIAVVREMKSVICGGCEVGRSDDNALAKQLAEELFSDWRVSNPGCDNGLLLFVALRDRQIQIVAGDDVWTLLGESRVRKVIDTTGALINRRSRTRRTPHSAQVGRALLYAVQSLTHVSEKLPSAKLDDSGTTEGRAGLWTNVINFTFCIFFFFVGWFAVETINQVRVEAFAAGQAVMLEQRRLLENESDAVSAAQ